MLLDGREVAGFIKERHFRQMGGLNPGPGLAIVANMQRADTASFVRAKQSYGEDIGVRVEVVGPSRSLTGTIEQLNRRADITGIVVQLPLEDPDQIDEALAAIDPAKDVDGLGPNSPYEVAAVKGILWLLAGFNIDLKAARVAVVGQGRLVGKPLSDQLESNGIQVVRCDINTPDLAAALQDCGIIVSATGRPGLITSDMVSEGMVVIDAGGGELNGKVVGDADPALYKRSDIKISPVPGGVGPMTVAALFDNLMLAAMKSSHPK
jgi:methylenetetrahydrofolate dehydrogenase (NADP+)/methenyltetrahydrofolate cyclohydrolase